MLLKKKENIKSTLRCQCLRSRELPVNKCTGCLNKTWTFFEIGIIPLFIKNSFQNFVWLKQNNSYLL